MWSFVFIYDSAAFQETDHLTPSPALYGSLAQALIKVEDFEKAYDAILKLKELGAGVGEGDASILG